ncbi:MAG: DciA family protein [Candidatus Avigastranaerophilus sp.]
MKRLNNSNFELLREVFKEMHFEKETSTIEAREELFNSWEEIIGDKIAKLSKVWELSADNILTIACADSFVANELYFVKDKIFSLVEEKAEKLGIKIKDIKFNYKIWKEDSL